ncbi:hypothetical protein GCM10007387_43520 [Pseudoduganella albidiflava]|uniref:Uncharacterized protein n=2 Tax=Pseudoduganella albidiflava TaxID=321983 RepID=A0A411X8H5_9BURK|nr:hypothetical protein EYF70_19515 [Pseudoduganella albidiflava]GGY56341.1 hypothetical protein GCM10007387_43520 [Pseudoduganella albidiflava]
MRWSRTGLGLSGMYVAVTAAAVAAALWAEPGDPKGSYVLLQLPIALQLAALPDSLLQRMGGMSWTMAYLAIWPPTLLALYALGHWAGYPFRRRR